MNIKKYLIVSFLSISLFGNTQALTKENKVRLAGVGLFALGGIAVTAAYNAPKNISRIEYYPDGSIRHIERHSNCGAGILTAILGLWMITNAQEIAEKR